MNLAAQIVAAVACHTMMEMSGSYEKPLWRVLYRVLLLVLVYMCGYVRGSG